MPRTRIWLALVAASLSLSTPRASAQDAPPSSPSGTPKAVVLAFSGPDGNAARTAAVRGLDGVIELESVRDALAAANELGVDVTTVEGRTSVAQRMGVTLVVHGRVLEVGRERRTEIAVESSDGRDLARVEALPPTTAAGRADVSAKTADAVRAALATLAAAEAPVDEAEDGDEVEDADEAGDGEASEDEAGEERSPTHVITALGGIGIRHRNATLDAGSEDRAHELSFATFLVHGDFFPYGDEAKLGLRGFHVGVDFAVGLGAKTDVGGGDENTPYYNLELDAGYLYPFRHGKAGFSAGYGLERYEVPVGVGTTTFPSTTYNMLRFALGGSYDVLRDLVAVTAEYGVRVPLAVGDLRDYGENSVAVGIDLVVGVEGGFDFGLAYAFRFGWQRYDLRMYGDPVGSFPQGEKGSDSGIWIDLMVGWRFR